MENADKIIPTYNILVTAIWALFGVLMVLVGIVLFMVGIGLRRRFKDVKETTIDDVFSGYDSTLRDKYFHSSSYRYSKENGEDLVRAAQIASERTTNRFMGKSFDIYVRAVDQDDVKDNAKYLLMHGKQNGVNLHLMRTNDPTKEMTYPEIDRWLYPRD